MWASGFSAKVLAGNKYSAKVPTDGYKHIAKASLEMALISISVATCYL